MTCHQASRTPSSAVVTAASHPNSPSSGLPAKAGTWPDPPGSSETGGHQGVPGAVSQHAGPHGSRAVGEHADEESEAGDHHRECRQPGHRAVPAEQDQRNVVGPPNQTHPQADPPEAGASTQRRPQEAPPTDLLAERRDARYPDGERGAHERSAEHGWLERCPTDSDAEQLDTQDSDDRQQACQSPPTARSAELDAPSAEDARQHRADCRRQHHDEEDHVARLGATDRPEERQAPGIDGNQTAEVPRKAPGQAHPAEILGLQPSRRRPRIDVASSAPGSGPPHQPCSHVRSTTDATCEIGHAVAMIMRGKHALEGGPPPIGPSLARSGGWAPSDWAIAGPLWRVGPLRLGHSLARSGGWAPSDWASYTGPIGGEYPLTATSSSRPVPTSARGAGPLMGGRDLRDAPGIPWYAPRDRKAPPPWTSLPPSGGSPSPLPPCS